MVSKNTYFKDDSWKNRLLESIKDSSSSHTSFPASVSWYQANIERFQAFLKSKESGARVLINLGSYALIKLLNGDNYKNCYDLAVGETQVDQIREYVDSLLFPNADGSDIYFGAAALESIGIRFYGDYALVLKPDLIDANEQIFDRDSYELIFVPFDNINVNERETLASLLKGKWSELKFMAPLKLSGEFERMFSLSSRERFQEALLRGEEFIEVHKNGSFTINDLEEVRLAEVDVSTHQYLVDLDRNSFMLSREEMLWLEERDEVQRLLRDKNIETRVVDSRGRN